ncbi:MAG: carbon-nitrogen hydrolase family protein [Chloroflexi bacterium]|nr:carbon-nitrogen hydrolase family protein [Chloroflexota bacterium]
MSIPDFPRYKAAAVQASPVVKDAPQWFDLEATLDKAVSLIAEAGGHGARLIVFPESWLPCYAYWSLDLAERPAFYELWAHYLWSSIEVPGPETEALCRAAKQAGAYVVMGINERDRTLPGRMYNSILYLSPQGRVLGLHRKICITVQERLFHAAGDGGDNLKTVFDTEIGHLGGSICGEHIQLTLQHNWLMQGLQVHCSLWPGTRGIEDFADQVTRTMCRIGHLFGVLSATYMPDKDMPRNFYSNSFFNIPGSIRGGSGIIGPHGNYIAGPVFDEETIVYGDIDLSAIDKTRFANNLTGYYNRWDLLNVNVSQQTYEPLAPFPAGANQAHTGQDDLERRMGQLEQQLAQLTSALKETSIDAALTARPRHPLET